MSSDSTSAPAATAPVLLSKDSLAARLGISQRTIDNLVRERKLPKGVRVGRRIFWTQAVVDTWLTRRFGPQQAWRG